MREQETLHYIRLLNHVFALRTRRVLLGPDLLSDVSVTFIVQYIITIVSSSDFTPVFEGYDTCI